MPRASRLAGIRAILRRMEAKKFRLLELLGTLSMGTDLSIGLPFESALRCGLISLRLARAWREDSSLARDAQIAALLRYLGCSSTAFEYASFNAGDDIGLLRLFSDVDVADHQEMAERLQKVALDASPAEREHAVGRMMTPGLVDEVSAANCEVASRLAEGLSLSPGIVSALADTYERFDGTGVPRKAVRNAISPAARLMHVAQAVEVLARVSSWDDAVAGVARRAGGQLDPEIVEVLRTKGPAIARGLDAASVMSLFLAEEPEPHAFVPEGGLLDIATAFARVVDLKSTFTLDHSVTVANLADGCAGALGIGGTQRTAMRAAALLHDLGRLGIPNGIWDKPGVFTPAERLRAEEHAYIGDRMLRSSALLAPLADLAGAHERLDASGYHRRVPAAWTPPAARLIAACDVYVALVSERPHRHAHKKKEAAAILGSEVRSGRLDRESVRVILDRVGQAQPRLRGELPAGLSPREVEVLALLARGHSNKRIGECLHVSESTVKNHVGSLYGKIGLRTRAGAALFAAEHNLLDAGVFEK